MKKGHNCISRIKGTLTCVFQKKFKYGKTLICQMKTEIKIKLILNSLSCIPFEF